jgi:hypothetical protein
MRGSSMLSDAGLLDLAGAAPGLEVRARSPGFARGLATGAPRRARPGGGDACVSMLRLACRHDDAGVTARGGGQVLDIACSPAEVTDAAVAALSAACSALHTLTITRCAGACSRPSITPSLCAERARRAMAATVPPQDGLACAAAADSPYPSLHRSRGGEELPREPLVEEERDVNARHAPAPAPRRAVSRGGDQPAPCHCRYDARRARERRAAALARPSLRGGPLCARHAPLPEAGPDCPDRTPSDSDLRRARLPGGLSGLLVCWSGAAMQGPGLIPHGLEGAFRALSKRSTLTRCVLARRHVLSAPCLRPAMLSGSPLTMLARRPRSLDVSIPLPPWAVSDHSIAALTENGGPPLSTLRSVRLPSPARSCSRSHAARRSDLWIPAPTGIHQRPLTSNAHITSDAPADSSAASCQTRGACGWPARASQRRSRRSTSRAHRCAPRASSRSL